jgi:hypothetical protein
MGTTKDKAEFWILIKTCKGKRYEDDSEQWDTLLKLLGIPLREQGILSRVIEEGRFAKADNPQTYLAMATRRQAKNLNLYSDLREKCELRGAVKGLEAGPISTQDWAVKQKKYFGPPKGLKANSHDEFIELAGFHYGEEFEESPSLIGLVPKWLLIDGEEAKFLESLGFEEMIDWTKVAKFSVSKPAMAELIGYVLSCRYYRGKTRREAMISNAFGYSPAQIQAAWKWIDRNWDSQILPLFRMDKPSKTLPVKKKEVVRLSPSEALNLALKREQDANKSNHW